MINIFLQLAEYVLFIKSTIPSISLTSSGFAIIVSTLQDGHLKLQLQSNVKLSEPGVFFT
mgnify:CR=1 FL=1